MKAKKVLGIILAAVMVILLFSACNTTKSKEPTTTSKAASLPIVTKPITLKWWFPSVPDGIKSWSDSIVFKQMAKLTNINIEFQIPTGEDIGQQYSLMIASGTLPDIVTHQWFGYQGGPDAAVEDGVYLDLTDMLDTYMPNYKKMINEAKVLPYIQSQSGKITWVAGIRTPGLRRQPPYVGPIIRKDWLDKLGLDEPVTINDWYNMLKAFKTQLKVKRPLLLSKNGFDWNYSFMNAYGVTDGFSVENGKIIYGPTDDRMLAYVTEMSKWYKEGLLVLETEDEQKYYDDTTASWNHGYYLLNTWKSKAKDPAYNAVGVPYPILKKGDVINVTYRDDAASTYGTGTFITTQNKYPKETARYFDYFYSDKGQLLQLYGVEGQTYNIVDGKPKFSEYMTKNKDKSFLQMLKTQTFPAFVNDWRIELQGFATNEVDAITNQWSKVKDTNNIPSLDNLESPDESREYQSLSAQTSSYAVLTLGKFIRGEEPLANWQAYVDQVKKTGSTRMIEILQKQYNKFLTLKK